MDIEFSEYVIVNIQSSFYIGSSLSVYSAI